LGPLPTKYSAACMAHGVEARPPWLRAAPIVVARWLAAVAAAGHCRDALAAAGDSSVVRGSVGDDAGSAIMLRKVSEEQVLLLDRLSRLQASLNGTLARAQSDLIAAGRSESDIASVARRVARAGDMSQTTAQLAVEANLTAQKVANETNVSLAEMAAAQNKSAEAKNQTASAEDMRTVAHQVEDNRRLLQRLGPRIKKLTLRLSGVEARLQKGNVSEVVEDAAKRAMSDVLRDLNRAAYQTLPSR